MTDLKPGALVWHPEHGPGIVTQANPMDETMTVVSYKPARDFEDWYAAASFMDADGWELVGETGFQPEPGAKLAWVTEEMDSSMRDIA